MNHMLLNITTPILLNLMQQDIPIDGYVVMMQKEVGERLNDN
jgi:16S rRNA (adenine1518-N6/adenine1519-N6)-dimethyltransferase